MLRVFSRHHKKCAHRDDIYYSRCRCPKWVYGVLPEKGQIRQSARTRLWERAQRYAQQMEQEHSQAAPTRKLERHEEIDAADAGATIDFPKVAIPEAVKLFLDDHAAQGNADVTTRKYRGLLERVFLPWAERERFTTLDQLAPPDLTRFRSTWREAGNGGSTIYRKHEMMATFFSFCVTQEYLKRNPMKALRKPKMPELVPTDYYRPDEFNQIIAATTLYHYRGRDCKHRATRLRAFVLVMRWAGFSIKDTVKFERTALTKSSEGDDQIFLYRAKTGVPVYVVIPPYVADLLRKLAPCSPKYFFWSGRGDPENAKRGYTRSLAKLFKIADIKDEHDQRKRCHAHMFRDTFAVELLLAGNPIDQVSLLLGHSSVKITEKHYAPFCKARQLQLTSAVKRVWPLGNMPDSSAPASYRTVH